MQIEVYPNHEDFAVRTMGMPGLGALGVTFDYVVAMDSPSARPPGQFHWASTLWHELSHVYVLDMTNTACRAGSPKASRCTKKPPPSPDWGDRLDPDAIDGHQGQEASAHRRSRPRLHPSRPIRRR